MEAAEEELVEAAAEEEVVGARRRTGAVKRGVLLRIGAARMVLMRMVLVTVATGVAGKIWPTTAPLAVLAHAKKVPEGHRVATKMVVMAVARLEARLGASRRRQCQRQQLKGRER